MDSSEIRVLGGTGDDTVAIHGIFAELQQFDGGGGIDSIDGHLDLTQLDLNNFPTVEVGRIDTGTLIGNDLDNVLSAVGDADIEGGGGNDSLFATTGGSDLPSALHGGAGNDMLIGGGGDDFLDGGAGNDVLQGSSGDDTLDGGTGADLMEGGAGNDTVDYSKRTGNLRIGVGVLYDDGEANEHDNVYLDVETILCGSGNDTVTGGDANNRIVGNGGNDSLRGNYGNDTLVGGSGTDTLNGEAGTDTAQDSAGDVLQSIEVVA